MFNYFWGKKYFTDKDIEQYEYFLVTKLSIKCLLRIKEQHKYSSGRMLSIPHFPQVQGAKGHKAQDQESRTSESTVQVKLYQYMVESEINVFVVY